jgi:Galactose-3-O-sulfotransferase
MFERLRRLDPRRKLRLDLTEVRSRSDVLAAERDAHLRARDCSIGERNEFLHQRDDALGERNELLRQRDIALGERNELLRQRDEAIGERNEYLRQRDIAAGERNEYLRQRDVAIGEKNLLADWSARHAHRADMTARATAAASDRLLLFLHLAKTGGVTLADILARNLATDEFLQIKMAETDASAMGTWSHRAVERALERLQKPQVDKLRAVWGHYRQGIQEHLPKPCAVVTLLREPVDRMISGYYYWDQMASKSLDILEDYLARTYYKVGYDNYMCRILSGRPSLDPIAAEADATTENFPPVTEADFEAAASSLDEFLVVGTTDQFDQTLLVLGSDLRWSLSDLVHRPLNVTASRPPHSDISDALREKILRWNRYDAMLTERARAHLARRIASYPGDFDRELALFRELNSLFQQGAPAEELRRREREARLNGSGQRQ